MDWQSKSPLHHILSTTACNHARLPALQGMPSFGPRMCGGYTAERVGGDGARQAPEGSNKWRWGQPKGMLFVGFAAGTEGEQTMQRREK